MSKARENILGRLAAARSQSGAASAGTTPSSARNLSYADTPTPRPEWSGSPLDRFLEKLHAAAATHTETESLDGVPAAVADYLSQAGLPQAVRVADHALLKSLRWPEGFTISTGTAAEGLDVSLSVADAAMAETGTLVLCSGPESPTTLNFLADHHLVVLQRELVVPYMEDVWSLLRRQRAFPPRSLNYITGPSRTADVEQTMQLGAHGPRSLHVLLVP